MESTVFLRFSFFTPPIICVSRACIVVNRSSSSSMGKSVTAFKAAINACVFSVCTLSLPSKLTGIPHTITPTPRSLAIAASAATSLCKSRVRKYVSQGIAYSLNGSLTATPILLSPISKAIARFFIIPLLYHNTLRFVERFTRIFWQIFGESIKERLFHIL